MNVKIADLMAKNVVTVGPHDALVKVRGTMQKKRIGALPVVGTAGEALGIITATDLIEETRAERVEDVMTEGVRQVSAYEDVSTAARVMRKHKIHHVVVTHEKKVVGILSSFDLLGLIEDKRFTMKNAPTPKSR
jgi:CBS domain-containing protein